jgi:hypothetical protein
MGGSYALYYIVPTPYEWDRDLIPQGVSIGSLSLLHFVIMHMFRCMITFASCFIAGKAQGWSAFPKYRASLGMKLS